MYNSTSYKALAALIAFTALLLTQYFMRYSSDSLNTMALNHLLISLSSAKLLPSKVIPKGFTPCVDLSITFNTKKAENGNLLRVSDVKAVPTIAFSAPVSAAFPKLPPKLQLLYITCTIQIYG
jgi:hypothetical protein